MSGERYGSRKKCGSGNGWQVMKKRTSDLRCERRRFGKGGWEVWSFLFFVWRNSSLKVPKVPSEYRGFKKKHLASRIGTNVPRVSPVDRRFGKWLPRISSGLHLLEAFLFDKITNKAIRENSKSFKQEFTSYLSYLRFPFPLLSGLSSASSYVMRNRNGRQKTKNSDRQSKISQGFKKSRKSYRNSKENETQNIHSNLSACTFRADNRAEV